MFPSVKEGNPIAGVSRNQLVDNYVMDQLIPYIGNKRKLLSLILKAVKRTGISGGVFYDAFSGSTVVSRFAKALGFTVISNDWEPYACHIANSYIRLNVAPPFSTFGGLTNTIDILNSLPPVREYISTFYCPKDDENYDPDAERMFYTQENGRRIDAIRSKIWEWKADSLIDDDEESVLLSSLIYQSAYCSNTSGVFKGFHRGWGGATKTAWYRIKSRLSLSAPIFWDNECENRVYMADASSLLDEVSCDIAYLDPPYNQHQYGANYHLLNTIALWDKPKIGETFEIRKKDNGKSAIRQDWLTERRSLYCYKKTASSEFADLVCRIKAKFILVSYSTDGIISFGDLLSILGERGHLSVVTQKYKRYRVSSQRPSSKSYNVEFVVIVDTGRPGSKSNIYSISRQIRTEYNLNREKMIDGGEHA